MAVVGSAKRVCNQCGYAEATAVEKKFSRFYLRKNGQVSRAMCKPCFLQDMKDYHARTYPERKEEKKARARAIYAANPLIREQKRTVDHTRYLRSRLIIDALILEAKKNGCSRCDEKDPVCLDLHHRDGEEKEVEISTIRIGPRTKWTVDMAKAEIAKTTCLCANHHRKEHAQQLKAGWKKGYSQFPIAVGNPASPANPCNYSIPSLDNPPPPAILEANKEAV